MATVWLPQKSSCSSASIVRWRASNGDFVGVNDPLVELDYGGETVEITSPVEGVVAEIYNDVGPLPVGRILVMIDEYSMPGRPAPKLSDYGLNSDDAALVTKKEARLRNWIPLPIVLIAAGAVFQVLPSWTIVGAFVGLLFGYAVSNSLADSILRRSDGRFNLWLRFKKDRSAFGELIKTEWEHDRRSHEDFWKALTGHQFEQELASLLSRIGYKAERTPGSGDEGIDIHLAKGGKKIIVQCKQTKNPVGPAIARELYGTLKGCEADEGWLATTAGATSGVYSYFQGKPLRVVTLSEIVSWSIDVNRKRAQSG